MFGLERADIVRQPLRVEPRSEAADVPCVLRHGVREAAVGEKEAAWSQDQRARSTESMVVHRVPSIEAALLYRGSRKSIGPNATVALALSSVVAVFVHNVFPSALSVT